MIRLRMIDQVGSGIRRMFQTQRDRFFPLPDYVLDEADHGYPRVEVTIPGQVLDVNYSQLLMKRTDLPLRQVLLLDRVQKKKALQPQDVQELRTRAADLDKRELALKAIEAELKQREDELVEREEYVTQSEESLIEKIQKQERRAAELEQQEDNIRKKLEMLAK